MSEQSAQQVPGTRTEVVQSFASTLQHGSDEEVADAVFDRWTGSYGEERLQLLGRMQDLRSHIEPQERDPIGQRVFRLLITVGEESGDMRFVHLAVESRDMLLYGY
jgi:hypothetical protein